MPKQGKPISIKGNQRNYFCGCGDIPKDSRIVYVQEEVSLKPFKMLSYIPSSVFYSQGSQIAVWVSVITSARAAYNHMDQTILLLKNQTPAWEVWKLCVPISTYSHLLSSSARRQVGLELHYRYHRLMARTSMVKWIYKKQLLNALKSNSACWVSILVHFANDSSSP